MEADRGSGGGAGPELVREEPQAALGLEEAATLSGATVLEWEWRLKASPERLWPLVSDTNRINRLARMASATFTEHADPEGGVRRSGTSSLLGLGVSWDEHPFEWQYPTAFRVLREFHTGVLKAYRSAVTLLPDGEGTLLRHRIELVPRLGITSPLLRLEGERQRRHWEHAYRAVEAHLVGEAPWPFGVQEDSPPATAAPPPEGSLAPRLFDHVMREHEAELAQIRPFVLADRWGVGREAVLEACLEGVRRALLTPQWSLACPHCRGAKGTTTTLAGLKGQVYCASCNLHFEQLADDTVELSFHPDPRYRKVGEATFCVGGPGATPHVFFQAIFRPLGGRGVTLQVPAGPYRLRGPRIQQALDLYYDPALPASREPVEVLCRSTGFQAAAVRIGGAALALRMVNRDEAPLEVVLESREWRDDAVTLAHLKAHPELFRRVVSPLP